MPDRINPKWVKDRVQEIAQMLDGEDEDAHRMESTLRRNVLKHIAEGTAYAPKKCAALAISTDELDFARWFS